MLLVGEWEGRSFRREPWVVVVLRAGEKARGEEGDGLPGRDELAMNLSRKCCSQSAAGMVFAKHLLDRGGRVGLVVFARLFRLWDSRRKADCVSVWFLRRQCFGFCLMQRQWQCEGYMYILDKQRTSRQ